MTLDKYMESARNAYDSGSVDGATYDAMIMNAHFFVDEDDEEYGLPDTYAEVEYDDFDDPEAIMGARWDDMNYMRYFELCHYGGDRYRCKHPQTGSKPIRKGVD